LSDSTWFSFPLPDPVPPKDLIWLATNNSSVHKIKDDQIDSFKKLAISGLAGNPADALDAYLITQHCAMDLGLPFVGCVNVDQNPSSINGLSKKFSNFTCSLIPAQFFDS
jgi:hypothetical protein